MNIFNIKGYQVYIDDLDLEIYNACTWYIAKRKSKNTYRLYLSNRKGTLYHRLILDNPEGDVDHVDGNGLNNLRSNLRICTRSQNNMNRVSVPNTTSKYKGVAWHVAANKWEAYISIDGKKRYLGLHNSEEEAALAYNKMAETLFGDYALLNVIDRLKKEYL